MVKVGIIGGSYAGISAAISAVENDAEVRVYEQKSDIGLFACGEIYTSGLYDVPPPPKNVIYYSPRNFIFHIGDDVVKIPLPKNTLWVTDRDKLQHILYEQAIADGVVFNLGKKVKVSKLKAQYDYVIDASGHVSQSSFEGYVKPIKHTAIALFYRVEGDFSDYFDRNLHFWWLNPKHKGYAWLFPKTENTANIGIGWDIRDDIPPKFTDLNKFFDNMKLTYVITERGAGQLPLSRTKTFVKNRIMITGEAAGLMNYCLGAGVHFAIASGREAGIAAARENPSYYKNYVKKHLLREVDNSKILYNHASKASPSLFKRFSEAIAKNHGLEIFFLPQVKLYGFLVKVIVG